MYVQYRYVTKYLLTKNGLEEKHPVHVCMYVAYPSLEVNMEDHITCFAT